MSVSNRHPKSKIFFITLAIVASIFAIKHSSTSHANTSAQAQIEGRKTVAVAKVMRENLARNITLVAGMKPYQEVNIYAKVAGYLKNIKVDVGSEVKAGDVIATLDFAEQQADLDRAQATFADAKLDFNRMQSISKKKPGLLAQEEIDKSRVAYQVAKANLEHAQTIFDYANITAPFDGIITKRLVDQGALIQAGVSSNTAMPVVQLADNTKLRLVLPIPESIVSQVKTGMPVTVKIDSSKEVITTKIARISGKLDDATRAMNVEVDIDNKDLSLTPGMYASVALDLDTEENVLSVPVQAISGKENPTVWVLGSDNKIEERAVKIGMQTADKAEIRNGLRENDLVIFGSRNAVNVGDIVDPKIIDTKTKFSMLK